MLKTLKERKSVDLVPGRMSGKCILSHQSKNMNIINLVLVLGLGPLSGTYILVPTDPDTPFPSGCSR